MIVFSQYADFLKNIFPQIIRADVKIGSNKKYNINNKLTINKIVEWICGNSRKYAIDS